ncbi:DUF2059 domain-containing protein [Sphingomonas sp.]|uniref:DUF2059 domain-containing protein n=1 Tax=Sphingomonas sp. TaxID=28214 RepID=UPI002EDB08BA
MIRIVAAASLALIAPAVAQTAPTPASPSAAPDPARLAAAEKAVAALVPKGIYLKMMRDQFPQMMDAMMAQMMGKTADELGVPAAEGDGGKTMGEAAASADPHFQERMKIMSRVMGEEMGAVFDKLEPRVRAGLSRSFARRYTTGQLNEINAFFATPTGGAFADQYLLTFMDPEVIQEMMAATPEMMKAMPAIMEKVEAATKHLPPTPKTSEKTDEND